MPCITRYVLRGALAVLLVASTPGAPRALAQGSITIEDGGTRIEFPERLTFTAHIESTADIERVVLEYGVEKLTCGTVTAKAFPDFEPGTSIDVSWTWEMLQSGSKPPGARIWYRWRAIDAAGVEQVSDERRLVWLDDRHDWQSLSRGRLTFHWYEGSRSFAEDLLNAAVDALAELAQTTGVEPDAPIDMYIYADTADMRDAVLYEPGWTGGLAYPDYNILIIGISPQQVAWGKSTEAHELTHVLVGHLTFSCLVSVPSWLNEGIAMVGEGGPDPASNSQLQDAIQDDRLLSVRALSGGFSEASDKADLSYAQSYSIVNYLVATYGRDKLVSLFGELRDGATIEDALRDAYGFGLDELESSWRAAIGARPPRADGAAPTPTVIPTPVPTYPPISAAPLAPPIDLARAPTRQPTPTAQSAVAQPGAEETPAIEAAPSSASLLLVAGVVIVVAAGVVVLALRSRKSL